MSASFYLSLLYRAALRLGWRRGWPRVCRLLTYPLLRRRLRILVTRDDATTAHKRLDGIDAQAPRNETPTERVEIAGLIWWVPLDDRRAGSLSDRVLRGKLPIAEILRTHPFVQGGVMIDIGANIGTTSIPRLLLGNVDRVYGAEPESANYSCLRRTIVENHLEAHVIVDRVAIGDIDGEARLRLASRVGSHRLMTSSAPGPKAVPVRCLTLDTWSERLGPDVERVTYIKCDTQGWEGHVLAGASQMLRRKPIVWEIEICPGLLAAAGTQLDDLCRMVVREFHWFQDLRATGRDMSVRPTTDLASAMRASLGRDRNYTNVLLFNER